MQGIKFHDYECEGGIKDVTLVSFMLHMRVQ